MEKSTTHVGLPPEKESCASDTMAPPKPAPEPGINPLNSTSTVRPASLPQETGKSAPCPSSVANIATSLTLLGFPGELREQIWTLLPTVALLECSLACQLFRQETSKFICGQVGENLEADHLNEHALRYLKRFRKATKALHLEPSITRSLAALENLLDVFADVELEVLSSWPRTEVFDDVIHDALSAFMAKQKKIKVASIPQGRFWVEGDLFPIGRRTQLASIITVGDDVPKGRQITQTSIVARYQSDSASSKRSIRGKRLQEISLFYRPGFDTNSWATEFESLGFKTPLVLRRMYIHSSNVEHLQKHVSLGDLTGVGFLHCVFDGASAQSGDMFLADLVRHKCTKGDTRLKELMNIASMQTGPEIGAISQATLEDLSKNLIGVETLCWHQHRECTKTLAEIIQNWTDSLTTLSWRDSKIELGYKSIAEMFNIAHKIAALALNHSLFGLPLQGQQYNAEMKRRFEDDGENLAVSKCVAISRHWNLTAYSPEEDITITPLGQLSISEQHILFLLGGSSDVAHEPWQTIKTHTIRNRNIADLLVYGTTL